MNCTTCRFELSQCLDGRLPSGRRAAVLQHAAECSACGTFWAELQEAQQLTLQLRRPRVGADFRESLWERIQAGEGTPEAVFREQVPMVTKLRYALTGAAAAAAALLCITWLGPNDDVATQPVARIDGAARPPEGAIAASTTPPVRPTIHQEAPPLDESPFLSATQRLRFNLVAVETARQLDQRYAAATTGLRRLASATATEADVAEVFDNADEFHTFGELLLDMRDRNRLFFTDDKVEPDLRFAVSMLGESRRSARNLQTVQSIVAPAFRRDRLSSVARSIALVQLDPNEEQDLLLHLSTQRPDIFPKLFFVLGNDVGIGQHFGMLRPGDAFLMDDECAPSWVAPRSEVEPREQLFRLMRSRAGNGGNVHVKIEIVEPGK